MGTLSKTAEERFNKIKKRGELPVWWTLAQVLVGGVFVVFLAFKLISGDPTPGSNVAVENPPPAVSIEDPAPSSSPSASSDGDGPAVGEGAVADEDLDPKVDANDLAPAGNTDVRALDESVVSVPNAALAAAQAATLAKFTGDTSRVPLAEGTQLEPPVSTYPNAVASSPIVESYAEGTYTITFQVDAAGDQSDIRRVGSSVVLYDNAWVWAGN